MSVPRKWRARLAAVGLALSSLTLAFNSHANPADAPPPAPVITAPFDATNASTQQQKNQTMLKLVEELVALGQQPSPDEIALNRKLDQIIAAVTAGADPHIAAGPLPSSVLNFMIVAANEMERPDIVAKLIAAGADVKRADQRGLSAVDYALVSMTSAQRITRTRIDIAIQILRLVEGAGGKITDAAMPQFRSVQTHKDLAINIVGMAALRDAGLVTQADFDAALNGPQRLADMARNLTDLSVAWLRANGAILVEHPDAIPGGPEPVRIAPGETLQTLAHRFVNAMGAADEGAALRAIADRNGITFDAQGNPSRALTPGETILIPIPPENSIGQTSKIKGRTWTEIATALRAIYHDPAATADKILDELARMNNMTRAELDALPDGATLLVTFRNDSYAHVQPLTPPPWAAQGTGRAYLIIIESADYHGKQTFRVAAGTNYGLNKNVDFSQFLNWDAMLISYPVGGGNYVPSDAQHVLLNLGDNPLRDRIIFSHSMGLTLARINHDSFRNDKPADLISYESLRIYLQRQENSRPIIFNAAGNEFPGAGRNVPPYLTSHSPRTINVGAVGRYSIAQLGNGRPIIAPYSTLGGELCALLPHEFGSQMEGTSFSTPLLAGAYRQFVEWYGDRLTYEEIMAAGMMTASRDILDLDTVNGYYRPGLKGPQAVPALFRTNGGGLAYSERCGPGVADLAKWNETLLKMVAMKQSLGPGYDADIKSHWVGMGAPASTRTMAGATTEYTYHIRVPHDMTLGRLTFLLPQHAGAHSDITIRTPAGFEAVLPRSLYDVVSTHAFAYEDVKAGSVIEIRTTQPLAASAAMILRGHADGNAIQMLREQLRRDGVMPAPLRVFAGNNQVAAYPPPGPPVTPANDNTRKNGEQESAPEAGNQIIRPVPMPVFTPR